MGWAFAWDTPEGEANAVDDRARPGLRVGKWGAALFGLIFGLWLFAYGTGFFTTLGWAEGSEGHNRYGIRLAEETSTTGLGTMFLFAGQTAWWDYEIETEGGGVRLSIASTPPRPGSIRVENITATGRGRVTLVAPHSGLYSFQYQYVPLAGGFGHQPTGATRYSLSWGVD
jgi:hypothetical protein